MSAFNRCKDCGSTDPESGWVSSAKSLCNSCLAKRSNHSRQKANSSNVALRMMLANVAALALGAMPPEREEE